MSQESITTISVKYDARDISDINIQDFKNELQELGYIRVRGHRGPMAGTGGLFSISITFIGLAALTGIIGHLAAKFFDKLAEKILSFIKKPSHPFLPIMSGIRISYDDIDIEITYVDDNIIKNISLILNDVVKVLEKGRLKEFTVGTITMPMEFRNGAWEPFFIEESTAKYHYPFHFWKIWSRDLKECFGIYDFLDKKFLR